MRKVLLSGALVLIGLAAPAAPMLASAAQRPRLRAAAPSTSDRCPACTTCPSSARSRCRAWARLLGGVRHATAVQSANWAGYADTNDTYNSVASSWTEPTVNCSNSGGGLNGLLGGLGGLGGLLGGPSAASAFWVGLDGYTSTSVEQLGTDSDCNSGTPELLRLVRDVPQPLGDAAEPVPGEPGGPDDGVGGLDSSGTSFTLSHEGHDPRAGRSRPPRREWLRPLLGRGHRRGAVVVHHRCSAARCRWPTSARSPTADRQLIDAAGKTGSLSAFNANEITMASNGHDAGHAEQPQPRRVVVLRDVEQLVTVLTATAPQPAGVSHLGSADIPGFAG